MSATRTLDLSGLDSLRAGLADLRPAWSAVALYLNAQARRCFDEQRSPDGRPWAPWARTPSAKRGGPSAKLLRDKGILMGSLTGQGGKHYEEITGSSLRWGTAVPYAGYHNFGTRTIPARPFLGVSEAMRARIGQIIADVLRRQLGGS